ncbi:MAG: hypothetical protein MJ093_01725 [Saccharofermentans sp.]|nr:hypothetical protein [Saccharofermentans sp.]
MDKNNNKLFSMRNLKWYIAPLIMAVCVFIYLTDRGHIPSGSDVWGHVYKADYLYKQVKSGKIYPLFDMYWYNGMETFRYWGPLSYFYYIISFFIAGGNINVAYRIFVASVFFFGGIPWVMLGIKTNKKALGSIIGAMWFMMPDNVHILIAFGNVPQIFSTVLIPYLILFIWIYTRDKNKKAAIGLVVMMALLTITHLMITAIVGVSTFVFLLIDSIWTKEYVTKIKVLIYMVLGIVCMGIWMIPAVTGGVIGASSSSTTDGGAIFVSELSISLNPITRFIYGYTYFYIGLALIIVCVFALIASDSKYKAGFVFLPLIVILSTPDAFELIVKLPLGGLFWMERFLPIAYAYFLMSIFEWKHIKNKYLGIIVALILIDIVPFGSFEFNQHVYQDDCYYDTQMVNKHTIKRSSVLDLSSYGPYMSYAIPDSDKLYTFGWAWQGATTADNIMLVNDALENEHYNYVFDRCLELGDDTVLIRKSAIPPYAWGKVFDAAIHCNYGLVDESETAYVFRLNSLPEDYDGFFGTIADYRGISIGYYAATMTTAYPSFILGDSIYIDDYTVEELTKYDTVFLTGFEYNDKDSAEDIVNQVANSGTRVIIDASHMPTDPRNRQEYFMGVLASDVNFSYSYPLLSVNGTTINPMDFSSDNANFKTKYISGVDNELGTFVLGNKTLCFLGTNNTNENVYFLGLNIMYQAVDVNDQGLFMLLDDLLLIGHDELPKREIVPIDVTYDSEGLKITSSKDNVNTAISFSDVFANDNGNKLKSQFNLLVVDEGTTNITYKYSDFSLGLVVSCVGIVAAVVLIYIDKRRSISN